MTKAETTAGNAGGAQTYILLDRTGSMSPIWDEALSSVNAYANELKKADGDTPAITLAVFDAQDGLQFDVLRRNVSVAEWRDVTNKEANPRGMTPLFDAMARMLAIAEGDAPERAVIVVMTDGAENASREVTREGVGAMLKRVQAKNWQVVFLGADFGNFSDADGVGIARGQSMAMGKGRMRASMSKLGLKSNSYYAAPLAKSAPIEFDDEDRAEAGEADVKST
jgi:hypothetical protein